MRKKINVHFDAVRKPSYEQRRRPHHVVHTPLRDRERQRYRSPYFRIYTAKFRSRIVCAVVRISVYTQRSFGAE